MRIPSALTLLSRCSLGLALALVSTITSAQEGPVNISADHAEFKENSGFYRGNVQLSQGTLRISAEVLTIETEERRIVKVNAVGSPANLKQVLEGDQRPVSASAGDIEYRIKQGEVVLKKNAWIIHQGSEIKGQRIVYNQLKQSVVADGRNGTSEPAGRVDMTFEAAEFGQK